MESNALPLMESFYSIQGEGYHTGKAAFFIRLGGCDIGCYWCDSKASWNPKLYPLTPIKTIVQEAVQYEAKAVVVTGGEPLLYNLDALCDELAKQNIETFLETSGTYSITGTWNWICLSPKSKYTPLKENYTKANELKMIIFEKSDIQQAEQHALMVSKDCKLYLQPEWSKREDIIPLIIDYIKIHPQWSISLQTHKYMGIP